jgi:hypothetical protein
MPLGINSYAWNPQADVLALRSSSCRSQRNSTPVAQSAGIARARADEVVDLLLHAGHCARAYPLSGALRTLQRRGCAHGGIPKNPH